MKSLINLIKTHLLTSIIIGLGIAGAIILALVHSIGLSNKDEVRISSTSPKTEIVKKKDGTLQREDKDIKIASSTSKPKSQSSSKSSDKSSTKSESNDTSTETGTNTTSEEVEPQEASGQSALEPNPRVNDDIGTTAPSKNEPEKVSSISNADEYKKGLTETQIRTVDDTNKFQQNNQVKAEKGDWDWAADNELGEDYIIVNGQKIKTASKDSNN